MRVVLLLCLLMGIAHAGNDDDGRAATGYRNGKRIPIRLVTVGWTEVELATARAFRDMQAAAAEDGVDLVVLSGFRSHDKQRQLYERWRAGRGNLAARPGYSNHQAGSALDIVMNEASFPWLTRHARAFGFERTVRSEPWHWEFTGKRRVSST